MAYIKVGILGASGYTGAELIRFLINHPKVDIQFLTAERHAGKKVKDIFPHFSNKNLPSLIKIDDVSWDMVDCVFCALPHATTQEVIKTIPKDIKVIDLSADFRLENPLDYRKWYGKDHQALELQKEAVYGLSEWNREDIISSRLIACPGCYPTSILLPLLPLVKNKLIKNDSLIIDSKSGVSGAGRSLKESSLFCEVAGGLSAYGIPAHRHLSEIEQELSKTAEEKVTVTFTPHLIPMKRGIFTTIYGEFNQDVPFDMLRKTLSDFYKEEFFVSVLDQGDMVSTHHVQGSNFCKISLFEGRKPNQFIITSVIDNLIKGASGQAVQNMNILYGLDEMTGLSLYPQAA